VEMTDNEAREAQIVENLQRADVHPRRLRGRCLTAGCTCTHYRPSTRRKAPTSKVVGRYFRNVGKWTSRN
jgi:hypothetical protein